MGERHEIKVIGPGGAQTAAVTVATDPPWSLALELPDGSLAEARRPDLFTALIMLREQLEDTGRLLCCQGARPDVYPSGMSAQMSGDGSRIAIMQDAVQRRMIWSSSWMPPIARTSSVEQQREAVRRLRREISDGTASPP
jgi:hypothetical protein